MKRIFIILALFIAAPAFGRIAARAATYLNLPPTEPVNPSLTKVAKP
jgi:multisubunit Na+/H+ antiporter MnhG subunit